jgi:chromosome segregation ATPase
LEAEIADKLNAVTMERNRLREQLRRMRASSESIADIRDRAQVAYSKLKQDMQVLLDKTNAEKTELQRAHVDLQRAHTELQHAFAQLQKDYMDDRMAIAMIAGRIYDPAIAASVERVMGAPSPVMASVWMQPSPPPHYQQPPSAVGSDPEKTKMPRSA